MQLKRLFSLFFVAVLIFSTMTINVIADEGNTSEAFEVGVEVIADTPISATPLIIQAGDEVTVRISILENPGVSTLEFYLNYDKDVLEFVSVEETGILGTASKVSNIAEKSFVRFLTISAGDVDVKTGVLFEAKFIVNADFDGTTAVNAKLGSFGCGYINSNNKYTDVPFVGADLEFDVHTVTAEGIVADPTCTEEGYTTYFCDACEGDIIGNIVPALGHTLVVDEPVAPNCTETGLEEGSHCDACGEILTAQEVIPALGHTEEILYAVAPTCTETGLTEGKKCSECDEIIVVQTVVDALGHTEETIPAVAPTCENTGLTEGKKCSVCGNVTVVQTVVDALGHAEEIIPAVAPTCENTGLTEGKKCSVCGVVTVAQTEVAALGHTEEVLAAVAPTCTETGLTEGKKCSVCGTVTVAQTEVAALGHDFADEFTVDVEATYEAEGQKSRHCSRCDEVTDVTVIAKLINSAEVFTDVKANSWFKEAVDYVVYHGLMNGKTVTTFAPNEATTRAQLVTVLWRLEGSPVVDADVPFTDLKQDWYKDAVAWAYANGIVNGKTATTFVPNGNITREEISAILYRYANFKGFDVTATKDLDFSDAGRVHDYAVDAMKWAYAEELVTGTKSNGELLLAPRGNATRAQIATLLMRFCENIAK